MAGRYILSARQQHGRIHSWDLGDADVPFSRLATFPVEGGTDPPQLAVALLEALKAGTVRMCEGHKSRTSPARIWQGAGGLEAVGKWDRSGLKEATQRALKLGRTHQEVDTQLFLDMLLEIERLEATR